MRAHLVDRETLVDGRGSFYEYGRFPDPAGDWLVIHARTQQGNAGAALTANEAHREFGRFEAQMFVGVAGSLKDDIEIGSVVVGDYVHNVHNAKVEDDVISVRPTGRDAAYELLAAADHVIDSEDWLPLIRDPVGTSLPARDAYPCKFPPKAEIKGIASGEEVVAGGKSPRYQFLRRHFNNCGAVEMEGWGAMSAAHRESTPAIVIRGISDMCAGKHHVHDEVHQPIAAAHAAALAFGILSCRSRAMGTASTQQTVGAEAEEPEAENDVGTTDAEQEKRLEFVFEFRGALEEWPDTKADAVVERIRTAIGDPGITKLRVEVGSVRLIVDLREIDVDHLDWEAIRKETSREQVHLLGGGTVEEGELARQIKLAFHSASVDLLHWEQTLPGGTWLERPELGSIMARFDSSFSSTVLLGEPGTGKSALLSRVSNALLRNGEAVLAIKADYLSPETRTEADLQQELRLPGLPSELVLRLAKWRPVYVVIDQLDALASQLDLRSERLNVLLNLVRRIGGVQNVHLLLSARTFEFNHDVRLRAIDADAQTLLPPPWPEVEERLRDLGINPETWPENAREVVRSPQALKTYLALARDRPDEQFTTYQAMLERLWQERIAAAPDAEALSLLASDVASQMAENEVLWLAASRFDDRISALNRLEAVGFLVRSENRLSVGFSHQTLFDYVLARTFVRSAGLLSEYVLERQDSLFVRAKLWSALNYLREAEPNSYERELLAIWRSPSLHRSHLRMLLIEFLGRQSSPREAEKLLMAEITSTSEFRQIALRSLGVGWFDSLASTAIRDAMVGPRAEANQALRILALAWNTDPDRVIALARGQWEPKPDYDDFLWRLIHECAVWTPDVEAMARIVLARTPISPWQVDHTAQVVGVGQPDVAIRLIQAKLAYQISHAKLASPKEPFPDDGSDIDRLVWQVNNDARKPFEAILEGSEWTSLPDLAAHNPGEFLKVLWPSYLQIFTEIISRSDNNTQDHIYPGQWVIEVNLNAQGERDRRRGTPIMDALQEAIEGVAEDDPATISRWSAENSSVQIQAVQELIAHGYEVASEALASEALDWIFKDHRRLQLGPRGSRETVRKLINAVSRYWSDSELAAFEAQVAAYKPPVPAHLTEPKDRKFFNSFVRATRKELLQSIDASRLSLAGRELVVTEQRALGDRYERAVHVGEGGWIGSPMEADAMARAKDADILRIFAEIPDSANWDHPRMWMRGGNIQLSRAFSEFAKANPERGFRLIGQFERGKQERAAGYALDALADDEANAAMIIATILELCDRGFETDEYRGSAARALEKIGHKNAGAVPNEVLDILVGWLERPTTETKEASEDDQDSVETITGIEDKELRDESLLWGHGVSTALPGGNFSVLSALAACLLGEGDIARDRLVDIITAHLPREKNPRVWQAFLFRLSNAGGMTPEGLSAFLRALFSKWPEILVSREAVIFLAYAQRWDDRLVFDLITDWNRSPRQLQRRAYGELVGLVAIVKGREEWIARRDRIIAEGEIDAMTGLAYACSNLWVEGRFHEEAGAVLTRLIPNGHTGFVTAVLDVFRVADELAPDAQTSAYLRMLAAPESSLAGAPSQFVVSKLQTLLPYEAEAVAAVAFKLIDAWRSELADLRTGTITAVPELADLAITLHRLGGRSRQDGVSMFEALIDLDAYGARETLAEIDGRFGERPGIRPRIPRGRARRNRRRAA